MPKYHKVLRDLVNETTKPQYQLAMLILLMLPNKLKTYMLSDVRCSIPGNTAF